MHLREQLAGARDFAALPHVSEPAAAGRACECPVAYTALLPAGVLKVQEADDQQKPEAEHRAARTRVGLRNHERSQMLGVSGAASGCVWRDPRADGPQLGGAVARAHARTCSTRIARFRVVTGAAAKEAPAESAPASNGACRPSNPTCGDAPTWRREISRRGRHHDAWFIYSVASSPAYATKHCDGLGPRADINVCETAERLASCTVHVCVCLGFVCWV